MPLYHFNIEDGVSYPDLDGTEFSDLEAARTEAVRRSGTLLRDNALSFWGGHGWRLIVTDARGMIMFTLHFLAVSSPATEHYGAHATVPDINSISKTRSQDEVSRNIHAKSADRSPS